MAQLGITVSNVNTYGGLIDGVKSVRIFRGQYKYKNLKDDEQYITISITGMKNSGCFSEGELSMPKSVARLVGQSLVDVTSNLASVEVQLE
jgi:hypothetical protein